MRSIGIKRPLISHRASGLRTRGAIIAMMEFWGAFSPTAREGERSRWHPALLVAEDVAPPAILSIMDALPMSLPECPPAPGLRPRDNPRFVRELKHPLPPLLDLTLVDSDVVHLPQPPDSPWSLRYSGPSPRCYWALFCVWRCRWSAYSGLSGPVVACMGVYLRSYLFQEEGPVFLRSLQAVLVSTIPGNTVGPLWLWEFTHGSFIYWA